MKRKTRWTIELHDGTPKGAWLKHATFDNEATARAAFRADAPRLTQQGGYIRLRGPLGSVLDMAGQPPTADTTRRRA